MVNPDDGYIGIKTRGKNKDEIKIIEKRVAEELDSFKTEKFMYFLFINALWIIISCVVLMYTENLLVIKVPIPDGIANCGVIDEDDDEPDSFEYQYGNDYDYGNDYEDKDESPQKIIKFQPFSLFFLTFYIILIVTQFICMIWHRLEKKSFYLD